MKKLVFIIGCLYLLQQPLVGSDLSNVKKSNFHPNRLIIKFKKDISAQIHIEKTNYITNIEELDNLNTQYKCHSIQRLFQQRPQLNKAYEILNLGDIYVLDFEYVSDHYQLVDSYNELGIFEYVELDYMGQAHSWKVIPDDPYFYRQWACKNDGSFPSVHPGIPDADIDMDQAWDIEQGSSDIIVGILDSGCFTSHPEFSGRIWTNQGEIPNNNIDDDGNGYIDDCHGWDFAYNDNVTNDGTGHGTNVTGIIGANSNNTIGYAGIDWNCTLMICKILNNYGSGYYSWWEDGIYYAVNNGAHVINMSVGGTSYSSSLQDAINYAYLNNVLVVCSMGNYNTSTPNYPAAFSNSFAVGATDTNDYRCNPFFWGGGSNYGSHIDVVAPGNYIYGLDNQSSTNYNIYWAGTSQAVPYITGLTALLLARDTLGTVDEIKDVITISAEDQVGNPTEDTAGWDQYYGWGRINAYEALVLFSTDEEVHHNPIFVLKENFPSPSQSSIIIRYTLLKPCEVSINLYDIKGKFVETIKDGTQQSGDHIIQSTTNQLSSGLYIIEFNAEHITEYRKCLVLK